MTDLFGGGENDNRADAAAPSLLPFCPRDFILFRRDSPNLTELAHRSPTPWLTDFFLLVSSTERDEAQFSAAAAAGGAHSSNRESPLLGSAGAAGISPSAAAAATSCSAAFLKQQQHAASDESTGAITIIVHICPVTGKFIHRNLRGIDVFDTRAEAATVLERNFGCCRVPDGQFGALFGACFVRNPVDAAGVSGNSIPMTELHLIVGDSPFSVHAAAGIFSPYQQHQQPAMHQAPPSAGAALFNLSRSPPIAPAPPPPSSALGGAGPSISVTPGFKPATGLRTICVSSIQLGVLCDPQVDYSAPATIQASGAGKVKLSLPGAAEMATLIGHYGQHLAFQCRWEEERKMLSPEFYSPSDFAAMDRDQLAWNYAEQAIRVQPAASRAPPPSQPGAAKSSAASSSNTGGQHQQQSLQARTQAASSTLETSPCTVPWNFGIAAALHHRSGCGGSSNLSWLCPKATPVLEQTVAGFGSGSSHAGHFGHLPPQQQQQQQQQQHVFLESIRVACVPTFVVLRASSAQLEPLDNATVRWNLFCAGTECVVATQQQQQQGGTSTNKIESKLWVCSCPRSASSSSSSNRSSSHSTAPKGASLAANNAAGISSSSNNPSVSPEQATEHLSPSQLKEFYAALENRAVSTMKQRWAHLQRRNQHHDVDERSRRSALKAIDNLFCSHVSELDFGGELLLPAEEQNEEDQQAPPGEGVAAPHEDDDDIKTLLISTTKSAWLDFVVSNLSLLEKQRHRREEEKTQQQQQHQSKTAPSPPSSNSRRSPSPDSALLLRIAEHCYHASRVAAVQCTVLGAPRIRALPAPPVVRLRINKAPITALSANRALVADILPTGVLRGIWCHNRVLRNSIAMTFAVPRGTRVAAVGFLRPVFCRPGGGSSSSSDGGGGGSGAGIAVPTRQLPGCPFPISNRPELKYKSPFPSTAWSATVCISNTPTEENPTVLVHDVALPIVMYTETKSGSGGGSSKSSTSAEHALCVVRLPPPAVSEQGATAASSVLSRGFFDTDDRHAAPSNNIGGGGASAAAPTRSSSPSPAPSSSWSNAATAATGQCCFVTVVLRGSLNSESAFGAHQVVLFGEEPDVLRTDAASNDLLVVPSSASAAPKQLSSSSFAQQQKQQQQQQQHQNSHTALTSEPQTLHEAIIAEEKRYAAQLSLSEWQTQCARNGGMRSSKLDLNAHVCEMPFSADIGKAVAAAGGNGGGGGATPDAAATTASTTCQISGCGKGGFFTRLSTCESCGKQACSNHWRKIKDFRILSRCSPVGLFLICNTCEKLGALLDTSMKELVAKRNSARGPALATTAIKGEEGGGGAVIPVSELEDTAAVWKRALICARNDLSLENGGTANDAADEEEELLVSALAGFSSVESGGGVGGLRAPSKVQFVSGTRVAVSFCVPRQAHASAERVVLLRSAEKKQAHIAAVSSVVVSSGDGAETVPPLLSTQQEQQQLPGDSTTTSFKIPILSSSSSSSSDTLGGSAVLSSSSLVSNNEETFGDDKPLPLKWSALPRDRAVAAFALARGSRRHVPFGAQQLAAPIHAVDVVTITLDVVSALTPQQGGTAQMLQAARRIFAVFSSNRAAAVAAKAQEARLATSAPQRRRAVTSVFAHDDDDDDEHQQQQHTPLFGGGGGGIQQQQLQLQQQGGSGRNSSSGTGGHPSTQHADILDYADSSSGGMRTNSLPRSSQHSANGVGAGSITTVAVAPPVQYSTECTADMSVRNMVLCPPGHRTHCRVWVRPPPPPGPQHHSGGSSKGAAAAAAAAPSSSPTHGVWGHAAGIMLRTPFAISPALNRGAPAANAATCVRSFRAFTIERSLYCRATHAATLHVPLVFLVTRSASLQNSVEAFIPFGQTVKEQHAAGFVLDVATSEKGCSSSGWEREWAALVDAASPFFVREPLQQDQQQAAGAAAGSSPNSLASAIPSSKSKSSIIAPSFAGYRGSPLATVNMGDAGSLVLSG